MPLLSTERKKSVVVCWVWSTQTRTEETEVRVRLTQIQHQHGYLLSFFTLISHWVPGSTFQLKLASPRHTILSTPLIWCVTEYCVDTNMSDWA